MKEIKKLIIFLMFIIMLIFPFTNNVQAFPVAPLSKEATKLISQIAKKAGLKGTTREVHEQVTKHVVHKLTKDGKVISPEQWVREATKAQTRVSDNGKWIIYTLDTAALTGMISLFASEIQELDLNEEEIELTYDELYGDRPTNSEVTGSAKWYIEFNPVSWSNYNYLHFYNYRTGQWDSISSHPGYWEDVYWSFQESGTTPYAFLNFTYTNPFGFKNNYSISIPQRDLGMLDGETFPHEFDFTQFQEDELVTIRHKVIPDYLIVTTPTGPLVPDPNSDITEVYIPISDEVPDDVFLDDELPYSPSHEDMVPQPQPEEIPFEDAGGNTINNGDESTGLLQSILEGIQGIFDWLLNMLQGLIDNILSLLNSIWQAIQSIYELIRNYLSNLDISLSDILNFLSGGLGDILNFLTGGLSSLLNNLWEVLQSIFAGIQNVLNWLSNLINNLLNALQNMLMELFLPSVEFLTAKWNGFRWELESKFPDLPAIGGFINSIDASCSIVENQTITVFGVTEVVVDWDMITPYVKYFSPFISAVIFLFLLRYAHLKVTAMLSARGGV